MPCPRIESTSASFGLKRPKHHIASHQKKLDIFQLYNDIVLIIATTISEPT